MDFSEMFKNNLSIGIVLCICSSLLYILSQGDFPEESKNIFLIFAILLNVLPIITDSMENAKSVIHFIAWFIAGLIIGICFNNWVEIILTIALTIIVVIIRKIIPNYY